jgi:hypothetical protein
MIQRREFITLLGAAAVAWPLTDKGLRLVRAFPALDFLTLQSARVSDAGLRTHARRRPRSIALTTSRLRLRCSA